MTNSLVGRSMLSVVIVNWNGRDDLLECLHSVTKSTYPYVRVIVVDNTSTDGSVAAIRATFPEVVILQSDTNIGLTANNLGIKEGLRQGTEYLLLLNNDTYVDPFCFSRLVEAAEANQMVGVLSPRICYYSERDTIWYDGGELQRHRGMWRSRHICFNESSNGIPVSNYQVDFISGCAMFIKRDVVEVIGCIDSRFFAYWEDVDFSLRARRAGF